MDAASMSELRVANEHLADPARLRALFADEGYLFFQGVLDEDAVLEAGRRVVDTVVEQGFVASGDDEALQDALNAQKLWERLVAVPAVASFFATIAGAPVGFIPLARYRIMPPGGSTQVHQDSLLNPGFDMTTAWIPLVAIDEELGGLALESHGVWRRHAYEPGDVVLMHEAMTHTGLPNRSRDGLRVSVDVRFQNPGAPTAVVGRICAIDAGSLSIEAADGEIVTLGVDDTTLLRNGAGQRIGPRVIASRRDGLAVMVKPIQ
jgi:hypothetical protein